MPHSLRRFLVVTILGLFVGFDLFGQHPPESALAKGNDDVSGHQRFWVTIWPAKAQVRPGEEVEVTLRVLNFSGELQSFKVMSCGWDRHWKWSNPRISYKGWPCWANAIMDVRIRPGEAYEKVLVMSLVGEGTSTAESLRMGFAPVGEANTYWSNEVVLGVAEPDPSSDFEIVAPQSRDGPRLTARVVSQPMAGNWRYDVHVTTADGLDQHLEIRNGQPLTPKDVRLADVNGDGFLDVLVVGGKDHRGEDWFKTWLWNPKGQTYTWINES